MSSSTYFEQLCLLGGLHELSLKFRYPLCSLLLDLLKPLTQLQHIIMDLTQQMRPLPAPGHFIYLFTGGGADLYVVILQIVHMIQHPSFVFSVFQQGTDVQHVVHVRLDLHMQLLTLCFLQILFGRLRSDKPTSYRQNCHYQF